MAYSHLISHIETSIVSIAGIGRGQALVDHWTLQVAGLPSDADTIKLFFDVCEVSTPLKPKEVAIRNKLAGALERLRQDRNEILHGAWFLSSVTDGVAQHDTASVFSTRAKKGSVKYATRRFDVSELENLGARTNHLREIAWAFGEGCRPYGEAMPGWPTVHGRLKLVNGSLVRRDPYVMNAITDREN